MAGSWVRVDCPPRRRFLLPGGRFPLPAGGAAQAGFAVLGQMCPGGPACFPSDPIDPGDVLPVHRRAKRPAIAAPSAAW